MGETRQGVLIEMVFQLGMSSVLKFKRMWAAIDAADYVAAAAAMRDSLWNKQTCTMRLVGRRLWKPERKQHERI